MFVFKHLINERRCHSCANTKRQGVAAIEFALIAPVFILFLFGVIELSLLLVTQHLLENAVYNASRTSKTGYIDSGSTQVDTVKAVLMDRLNGLAPLLDTSKVVITYSSYATLSNLASATASVASLGGSSQIMVYTVTYPWTFFTPIVSQAMGHPEGTMDLTARIVVRNEPY